MKYFLRADPWQLFLLLIAPILVTQFTSFANTPGRFYFLVGYFLVIFLGWCYAVGNESNRRLPATLQINASLFKVALLMPLIYLAIFYFGFMLPLLAGDIQRPPVWIIPLHFVAIFSVLYVIWYTAKQFVTFEQNQTTSFIDYYPAFMGFWICFIGVWFLQPRVIARLSIDSDE